MLSPLERRVKDVNAMVVCLRLSFSTIYALMVMVSFCCEIVSVGDSGWFSAQLLGSTEDVFLALSRRIVTTARTSL